MHGENLEQTNQKKMKRRQCDKNEESCPCDLYNNQEDEEIWILTCGQCKQSYKGCCIEWSLNNNDSNSSFRKDMNGYFLCKYCSETREHQLIRSRSEYNYVTRRSRFAYGFRESFIPHVYCICGKKDDGKLMVECGSCEEWYHAQCVNISLTDENIVSEKEFICNSCSNGNGYMFLNEMEARKFYPSYERCTAELVNINKRKPRNLNNIVHQIIKNKQCCIREGNAKINLEAQVFNCIHFERFRRFEVSEGPWSLFSIKKSNRFLVGSSQGSLSVYSLKEGLNITNERTHIYSNWLSKKTLSEQYQISMNQELNMETSCSGFAHITMCPEYSNSKVFGSCWFDEVMVEIDLIAQKEIYVSQEHTAPVRSFDYSQHFGCLLTSSFDKTIKLWDTKAHYALGAPITTVRAHTNHVTGARFVDNNKVISISSDSSMKVWDIRKLSNNSDKTACLKRIDFGDLFLISLTMPDDHSQVAINTDRGAIYLFPLDEVLDNNTLMRPCNVLRGHFSSNWKTLHASYIPGMPYILCGSEDGNVCLWHEPTGLLKKKMLHSTCVWSACYCDEPDTIVTASEDMSLCAIKMFDTSQREHELEAIESCSQLHGDSVLCRFGDGYYYHAYVRDHRYSPETDDILFDLQFRGWLEDDPETFAENTGSTLIVPEQLFQHLCSPDCEVEHSPFEIIAAQHVSQRENQPLPHLVSNLSLKSESHSINVSMDSTPPPPPSRRRTSHYPLRKRRKQEEEEDATLL